jgi:hypothetical protein
MSILIIANSKSLKELGHMPRYSSVLVAIATRRRLELLTAMADISHPCTTSSEKTSTKKAALSQHIAKLNARKLVGLQRLARSAPGAHHKTEVEAALAALNDALNKTKKA